MRYFPKDDDKESEAIANKPEAKVIKIHHQNYEFYLLQEHKPVLLQITDNSK